MQGSTAVILLNFNAKYPPHRQDENRYVQFTYGEKLMKSLFKYIFIGFIMIGGANVFSQFGNIKVYVADKKDNSPLTNWQISIISSSNTKKEKVTNLSEYTIKDFPVGIYTIRIEKRGYQILEFTNVQVKSNYIAALSFKLNKRKCGDKKLDSQEFNPLKVDPEHTNRE